MFSKNCKLSDIETKILEYWKKTNAFEKSKDLSKGKKEFVFYDGPPFATGLPHYGHILSGTVKDIVGRFKYQQGYSVERKFGWDCHGLPVEYEIDKKLNIKSRQEILEMGIKKYNDECRSVVMRYSSEWKSTVERMGRWSDFENGYKTMDKGYMESVWSIFKRLYDQGKIYRGYKVMAFSTACKTPLSNFESNQNYKDTNDPSVLVAFPLCNSKEMLKNAGIDGKEVSLVAWTTTPWTLPSNCGLAVNRAYKYSIFELKGNYYIIGKDRLESYFKDINILGEVEGGDLVGMEYEPPFSYFTSLKEKGFFRVLDGEFVSDKSGTCIVHMAPAFGEEDYNLFVSRGLLNENEDVPCPVDENGNFMLDPYKGVYIKDLDKRILKDIKERILMNGRIVHSYPFCWRSDTPLIYKLVPNWFIRVRDSREMLLRNNEEINWIPETIKYGRFHNWLAQCRDWAVGRDRFWGTPIPIWTTEDYSDFICIGSIKELEDYTGTKIDDIHRDCIDHLVIVKDGKKYRRVESVLDCWFESGSMPYAQDHCIFGNDLDTQMGKLKVGDSENTMESKDRYLRHPSDFIGEGLDQTRGWFYTLHVISSLLFDRPAFRNVVVFGIVLADDGKKMSKRLKNYPSPSLIFEKYGADSLRLYLIGSPVTSADNLRFSENGVSEIAKTILIPWYNSLIFYMDCKIEDGVHKDRSKEFDLMKEWIYSSLGNFASLLVDSMNEYSLGCINSLVVRFIDDLSNWFIRINRKVLRENGNVLGDILERFSVLMAPLTPFFSEYCYQCIREKRGEKDPESIHHVMYPEYKLNEHTFESIKGIIDGVRQMRDFLKIKLKRPLRGLTIVSKSARIESLRMYEGVIMSECNILSVKYDDEKKYKFRMCVKPYFENLKKSPGTMKEKMQKIQKLRPEEIEILVNGGYIDVGDSMKIEKDDVIIEKKFVDVKDAKTLRNVGIVLDTTVDDEILELEEAREFYSYIQKLRKTNGLVMGDKVSIVLDSDRLRKIGKKYYPGLVFDIEGKKICEEEYEYGKTKLKIVLYKY